jgi:hypothetical protein
MHATAQSGSFFMEGLADITAGQRIVILFYNTKTRKQNCPASPGQMTCG